MRKVLLLVAALALAGCETLGIPPIDLSSPSSQTSADAAPTPAPTPEPAAAPAVNPRAAEGELFEAERRLAAAAGEQGYGPAIAAALDPAARRSPRPGNLYQGTDAVGRGLGGGRSGPIFWAPDRTFVSGSGDMGVTSGRYVEVDAASRAVQGRYVVVWRRDAAGAWRVLGETRTPDPAPAARRR